MAVELLASLQPFIFFQYEAEHTLSIQNILYYYASAGSIIWEQIAVSTGSNIILIPLIHIVPAYTIVFIIIIAGCLCSRKITRSFLGSYPFARALWRFIITLLTY